MAKWGFEATLLNEHPPYVDEPDGYLNEPQGKKFLHALRYVDKDAKKHI